MNSSLSVAEFVARSEPIFDVRSPGEYHQGHIPGALNFPLFDNDERAQVGTCYKHQGREAAIELGLALVSPKLPRFVQQAKQLVPDRHLRLHCWRGGMRSSSMAWLLQLAGFEVWLLEGGYKAFRRWGREVLARPQPILSLAGMTGTGKTAILQALAKLGEQVLDLEALANHRGSSYGSLGLPAQPSNEHFENQIAVAWSQFDPRRPVWIEAESRRIGLCRIPDTIFGPMLQAPIVQVQRSREERIQLLVNDYGQADPEHLVAATERLRKRLGGLRTQESVEFIRQGDLASAIAIVLDYYDRTYTYDLQKRQSPMLTLDMTGLSPLAAAKVLLAHLPS